MAKKEQLKLVLVKSLIGKPEKQRRIVRALGLGKLNSSVTKNDTPQVQGMVYKVGHLLKVERVGK